MLLRRSTIVLNTPKLISHRNHFSDKKSINKSTTPPRFIAQLAQLLEIGWPKSRDIIAEHRKLLTTKYEDIEQSIRMMELLNYTKKDCQHHPALLYTNALTIENRHTVLQECGCVNISAGVLSKYIIVMNREIKIIKTHGIIPYEVNVIQKLAEAFKDVQLAVPTASDDSKLLKTVREEILNMYLRETLAMTEAELQKLWNSYSRIRNRSFKSVMEMVGILKNELNFSNERIIKNTFVLYADPANVRRMLNEVKKIGDEDIRAVIYRRPKIMMVGSNGIKKIVEHISSYGIEENTINKCLDVLTLSPDTVLERLEELDKIDEFRVLKSNPRILRLIHFQNKARLRLEYLNQMKVKCASLHVLSSHADAFERYAKEGTDKGKGCDSVNYLASVLKRSPEEIRDIISRHPNWCHVPPITLTQAYEYLVSKLFDANSIFPNVQILLYPVKRINDKLMLLQQNKTFEDMKLFSKDCMKITNQEMLALCLYLIEVDFHFTGDGIWTDEDLHPVENFNSIIPDFPDGWKKGYKYGTKPITINNIGITSDLKASLW